MSMYLSMYYLQTETTKGPINSTDINQCSKISTGLLLIKQEII